tara:strand:- start:377 stop:592 length:216 start_codon:yes stop_codon:yes gene_type:complete
MKTFNTIRIMEPVGIHERNDELYGIYWTTEDTAEGGEYICSVYGFENAVRVANGIAWEQAEFVIHPTPPRS